MWLSLPSTKDSLVWIVASRAASDIPSSRVTRILLDLMGALFSLFFSTFTIASTILVTI